MIDLSILVCSINTRYDNFLLKIEDQLFKQYEALSDEDRERVEILVLTDNKQMMLGHKRNTMVNIAQGKYITFVDDDDRVAEDYIQELLNATASDADSIVFQAAVSLNGALPKTCYYSKDYGHDYNKDDGYYRIPNHICCIKREVSLKSSFPNVLYGEDAGYGKVLLPHLKTEHKIDKILYYYDYNARTTETQAWRYNRTKPRNAKPIANVVMLCKTLDRADQRMTQAAIDSCYFGSNGLPINITVVENGNRTYYTKATAIHKPGEFNFNEFLNTGAGLGEAEWIVCANNDLTFHDGWLHNLIAAGNDVVSSHEPNDPRQADITENTSGDVIGKHFSGWCFMVRRSLWESIGKFDTDVSFWCSDDAVVEQFKAAGVMPMLVKNSIVEHNASATLKKIPNAISEHMKWGNVYKFNKKYGKNKFADHPQYQDYLRRHINDAA